MDILLSLLAGGLALLALGGSLVLLGAGERATLVRLRALQTRRQRPADQNSDAGLQSVLERWGQRLGGAALAKEKSGPLQQRLIQAGFYSERAVEALFAVRALFAAGLSALTVAVLIALRQPPSLFGALLVVGAANVGLFLPYAVLSSRVKSRAEAVRLGMPDAVDLMVVAVEAGSTLTAALQRVEVEFRRLHPVLAEQFQMAILEMQAGSSRAEALQRMADRIALNELRPFIAMLVQSEALGASLGQTLRVFSDELRRDRFLDAERRAAELPVKLAFPLVFCIFPCLCVVILVPVVIRLVHAFSHLGQS